LTPLSPDGVAMPFVEGEVLAGKYQIVRLIGAGGMGYVVSANHLELDERVALKFLRPEALKNEELVGRFAREAQAAARIKGEHVARVYDVSRLPDGTPFIVMEHLEGKDLCDYLGQHGPMSVKMAVEYVLQACEGLAGAHAVGIVHRDIKPENLFLARRSGVDMIKVLDFGISKMALTGLAFSPGSASRPFVKTQMPMGSPVYMSPEQIRDTESVDARTDIWSMGCVLMELLTGKSVFDAPSIMQLSAMILEQDAPKLRSRIPDASPEMEAIIARCLERDISKRFQSVAELAVALYPFGPRRARLSAERCCHLLQGQTGEFELPTMPPPTSNPAGSQPASRIVLSQGAVGAITAASLPDVATVTGAPAIPLAVEPPAPKAVKSSKAILFAAVALVVGAGAAYAVMSHGAAEAARVEGAQAVVTAPAPAPATPVVAPGARNAQVPTAVVAEPPGVDTDDVVDAKSRPANGAKRLKRPAVAAGTPKPAPHKDKPKARGDDDVDVGF
jgi:serine/threonine-protein kinase